MAKRRRTSGRHSSDFDEEDEEINTKKKRKKKPSLFVRIIKKILMIVIILIVIALGIVVGYGYNLWNQIDHESGFDKNEIEINEGVSTKGYYNIILYGVDARNQKNSYEGS